MTAQTCRHCGEEIGQLNNDDVWYHDIDCGPDRHQYCICECDACKTCKCDACKTADAGGRYSPKADCCDGEFAEPEGELV